MIRSFLCRETEKIFNREISNEIPEEIQRNALIKMRMLNRAYSPRDLKTPPKNKFELTRYGNKSKYSIPVGGNWKLRFSFTGTDFSDLELLSSEEETFEVKRNIFKPVHPGEILEKEFLTPLKLSQNKLAVSIGVPPRRINEIVLRKRKITADTAIRLGKYFNTSPEFWLGLQTDYELDVALTI